MAILLDANHSSQLNWAIAKLRAGLAIALPTETVYGLAALALDEKSLTPIFALKARPTFDPLIVHVPHSGSVEMLAQNVSPLQKRLMEKFWPGPLTILFEKKKTVPDLCTAGSAYVAIRCPANEIFLKILRELAQPLAAPSANRFGRISPTTALDVIEELGPYGLEAVVDGGPCQSGVESTVIKIQSEERVAVLRPGALSLEELKKFLGEKIELVLEPVAQGALESPGQLSSHYAPRCPLSYVPDESAYVEVLARFARENISTQDCALLEVYPPSDREWDRNLSALPWKHRVLLSKNASDQEAASALFAQLRSLDRLPVKRIVARSAAPQGLGLAINDRLKRAGVRGASPKM